MAKTNEADADYDEEIKKARRELRALIFKNNCAPLMLRLAWHDAATYDEESKTGGPNGSIRTEQELNYAANKGLRKSVQLCEEVKAKLKRVSYADLYQLAGVVAVEITGGPTIDFQYGRTDSNDPQEDGLLPDPNQGAPYLRNTFYRMGLEDKDIVVLSGGHTLGKAHKDGSDFEGQWTRDPLKFDKSYFVELLKGELLKLPTDKALLKDKKFREHVEAYAKDEDAFFRDYATSHKKFSELGCDNLKNHSKPKPQEFIRYLMPKMQPEDQLNLPNKEVSEEKEGKKEGNEPGPSAKNRHKLPGVQPKKLPKKLIVIASAVILGYLLKRKIQAKKQ